MAVYVYIAILVTLFTFVAIIFNGLDYALTTSEDEFKSMINSSTDTIADYSISTRATLRSVWQYWPIYMFLMLVLWAIVAAQRKEDVYGV